MLRGGGRFVEPRGSFSGYRYLSGNAATFGTSERKVDSRNRLRIIFGAGIILMPSMRYSHGEAQADL
jgi:hypothetical protein